MKYEIDFSFLIYVFIDLYIYLCILYFQSFCMTNSFVMCDIVIIGFQKLFEFMSMIESIPAIKEYLNSPRRLPLTTNEVTKERSSASVLSIIIMLFEHFTIASGYCTHT